MKFKVGILHLEEGISQDYIDIVLPILHDQPNILIQLL